MADGFLGRWAKRKEAVRKGEVLPPEPVPQPRAIDAPPPPPRTPEKGQGLFPGTPEASPGGGGSEGQAELLPPPPGEGGGGGAPVPQPAPTLEDTHSLTKDSDFTRFTRPDVAPEVKTAAFKKLFADPHFNVMDGLDVYIDDYGKPDPIPPEMLRSLASAKFLKLFDDEEEKQEEAEAAAATPREVADQPPAENVAQSGTRAEPALPPAEEHADPDLRLQQDDAPGPEGPGAGAR